MSSNAKKKKFQFAFGSYSANWRLKGSATTRIDEQNFNRATAPPGSRSSGRNSGRQKKRPRMSSGLRQTEGEKCEAPFQGHMQDTLARSKYIVLPADCKAFAVASR